MEATLELSPSERIVPDDALTQEVEGLTLAATAEATKEEHLALPEEPNEDVPELSPSDRIKPDDALTPSAEEPAATATIAPATEEAPAPPEEPKKQGRCIVITCVRHGQTPGNVNPRNASHDDPLTARGREQADSLGKEFTKLRIDRICSSDLARARDTAQAIIDEHQPTDPKLELRQLSILREHDTGPVALRHMQIGEAQSYHYELTGSYHGDSKTNRNHCPTGGESLATVRVRGQLFLRMLWRWATPLAEPPDACKTGEAMHRWGTFCPVDQLVDGVNHTVIVSHNVFLTEFYELLYAGGLEEEPNQHIWTDIRWNNGGWSRHVLWFPPGYEPWENVVKVEMKTWAMNVAKEDSW